jgi:DNA-binding response OmpR family regulator
MKAYTSRCVSVRDGAGTVRARRRGTGSRILLVEDSDDLRALMVVILESEGYRVDSARSAEEGLRLLRAGTYDLVLSDYALPGRTGTWLLREAVARQLLSRENAIIVTAHPKVCDADGFEVIHKPLDFDAFLGRLREYLDEHTMPGGVPVLSHDRGPAASGAKS